MFAPDGGFWVREWRRPGDPEGERWLAFDELNVPYAAGTGIAGPLLLAPVAADG